MRLTRLLIALPVAAMVGCTAPMVKEADIVEVDPYDQPLPKEIKAFEPTAPIVELGANNEVLVIAYRAPDVEEEDGHGNDVSRQVWDILVTNQSPYHDKCVAMKWRLMDFKLHTERETEFLVTSDTTERFGTMVGEIWDIDGVRVAPPPSGYIHDMRVRKPIPFAPDGEECLFIADEDDIKEK